MSLLDVARASSASTKRVAQNDYTSEHYELAAAFVTGEINASGWRAALKTASGAPETMAVRILRDGIVKGVVRIEMCPPALPALPRLCDGAVEEVA